VTELATSTLITLANPLEVLWYRIVQLIPGLLAAIILLIIGYILGLALGHLLTLILEKIGIDKHASKANLIKQIGHTHFGSIIGEILKWWVFIIFLQAAVALVDLGSLSDVLNRFVLWLPNLIVAIVVILFALIFAHYIEIKIVENTKVKGAGLSAGIFKWAIIIMAVIIALNQIGINIAVLEYTYLIAVASVGLGVALALGIGIGNTIKGAEGKKMLDSIKRAV